MILNDSGRKVYRRRCVLLQTCRLHRLIQDSGQSAHEDSIVRHPINSSCSSMAVLSTLLCTRECFGMCRICSCRMLSESKSLEDLGRHCGEPTLLMASLISLPKVRKRQVQTCCCLKVVADRLNDCLEAC